MAHVAEPPTSSESHGHAAPARTTAQHPPVTPGKVAMWLFLATEIMFFTGLIGSYIVLRAGTPPTAFSNLYPPATDLADKGETKGLILEDTGPNHERVTAILEEATALDALDTKHLEETYARLDREKLPAGELATRREEALKEVKERKAKHFVEATPVGVLFGVSAEKARKVHDQLVDAKAEAKIVPLTEFNWPRPYDFMTNPLSIDLTAVNTFILICSSVTMVLALSAFQRDERRRGTLFLLATTLIGSTFLGVQVFEYYQLMEGHHYPPGISMTGHFRPSVSIFASCFFTMTGFHGAHVAGGVVMLACLTIRSALTGAYTKDHHSPVELIGLYWHFVDLVWILLFTVVYLI